ncbi:Hypothetical predicted protein [Pelobates cultripes]|uniref:Uncharacterized protein n=1 Tax=Pelobates cultripes TaxID=61616 RepID=A0AAD1SWP3_PELCU|nr:Hypothetical predicted protein [Pelobates cultripes]
MPSSTAPQHQDTIRRASQVGGVIDPRDPQLQPQGSQGYPPMPFLYPQPGKKRVRKSRAYLALPPASTRGDLPEPGGLVQTAGRSPLTRQRNGEAITEATTGSTQGLPRHWESASTHSRPQNSGRTRSGNWPHTLSTAAPGKQHRHES